ncbi:kinase-like protein [Sporormia fimetaria CBS 119925]|uniref:Kinase-like protein n=1 Tax=Sporormia fimetaria CBS 119925 TaxID=1340428 RepID=A0A6A6VBA3_9PLEO|nr:kinase-like protein [Sporormia fimetaria CBS 119925]
MDFGFSSHGDGGTMHLASPTHRHNYGLEMGTSLKQIRRSLSRSPSKPSRFQLRRSESSGSPISPLALSRAFSPKQLFTDRSPAPFTPQTPAAPNPKKRIALRRSTPLRFSPRNHNQPPIKSPRRVLADSTNNGNASPFPCFMRGGEENMDTTPVSPKKVDAPPQSPPLLEMDDTHVHLPPPHVWNDLSTSATPPRATPMKRTDGIMNLDVASGDSPTAKRRSMHAPFGSAMQTDLDVFDATPGAQEPEPMNSNDLDLDLDMNLDLGFGSPVPFSSVHAARSPLRKSNSLRKSTLSQRFGARSMQRPEGDFALSFAPSKPRQRVSLDSAVALDGSPCQTPARRPLQPLFPRPAQPHPLSQALSPSFSTPEQPNKEMKNAPAPSMGAPRKHPFSRSLPLNMQRPAELVSEFETPMGYKAARPDPEAFMSTGLLSKKNRNLDVENAINRYQPPGTPSKRASFPPQIASPSFRRGSLFQDRLQQHAFGQPSTPYTVHRQTSSAALGRGVGIFGSSNVRTQRRSSFGSVDDETSRSPLGSRMMESQSSTEDMPPTPTKQTDAFGRRKDSSLRRQTFGHRRISLGSDTFAAPEVPQTPTMGFPPRNPGSPHTPSGSFTPPDPSSLSISGRNQPFNSSTNFAPATPTTPRDSSFLKSSLGVSGFGGSLSGNDFDVSLYERFDSVSLAGKGVFSSVYRAEKRVARAPGFSPRTQVWAVKKSIKPFAGPNDRQKKLNEVRILEELKGHEHVISLEDHWEVNGHLYIQTEYCEEGNLQNFLDHAGNKGRLDEFRIWKILLEITLGVKHIHERGFVHLDLKPANVLITFDGVLKIADFGMATTWPVPPNTDGEGDRTYMAPEALHGRFDKPCDIFTIGLILLEAASNFSLPENGASWQRLRHGDLSEIPSLTWSSDLSLQEFSGEPFTLSSDDNSFEDSLRSSLQRYSGGLAEPPSFMVDNTDPHSLQQVAQWLLQPDPAARPTASEIYSSYGVQWVERRSRAGATIFEGIWGPADEVLDDRLNEGDKMDTD